MKRTISSWLGEVLSDERAASVVAESEARIAKAYREYLRGYGVDLEALVKIVQHDYKGGGTIEQAEVPFFSMCAHHFLPFFGTVSVRYTPTTHIIGIGKLARIVDCFAARLTMQETIVQEVGDFVFERLKARAVHVESSARHLCVEARGPRAVGAVTRCAYERVSPALGLA